MVQKDSFQIQILVEHFNQMYRTIIWATMIKWSNYAKAHGLGGSVDKIEHPLYFSTTKVMAVLTNYCWCTSWSLLEMNFHPVASLKRETFPQKEMHVASICLSCSFSLLFNWGLHNQASPLLIICIAAASRSTSQGLAPYCVHMHIHTQTDSKILTS